MVQFLFFLILALIVLTGAAVAWSKIYAIEERHKFSHFSGISRSPKIAPTHPCIAFLTISWHAKKSQSWGPKKLDEDRALGGGGGGKTRRGGGGNLGGGGVAQKPRKKRGIKIMAKIESIDGT